MEARIFISAVALLATTILLHSSVVAAVATTHVVGGRTGWTIPLNTSFYSDWSSSRTIAAGDTIVFNFPTGIHTVVEVPKSSFDSCSAIKPIGSTFNNGPATVTVTSGTHYYICSVPAHCSAGQKLAITVATAAVAPSVSAAPPTVNRAAPAPKVSVPAPATAPPKRSAQTSHSPAPTAVGTAHVVGGSTGWTIPLNTSFYSDWSSSQTIAAGDTIVFNFPTGIHTVVEVPKLSFDSCSTIKQIGSTFNNGPATVTVTSGIHYYICSVPGHCTAGQKLAITVTTAAVAPSVSAAPPTVNRAAPATDGSNSSPALPGAARKVIALLMAVTAYFLF